MLFPLTGGKKYWDHEKYSLKDLNFKSVPQRDPLIKILDKNSHSGCHIIQLITWFLEFSFYNCDFLQTSYSKLIRLDSSKVWWDSSKSGGVHFAFSKHPRPSPKLGHHSGRCKVYSIYSGSLKKKRPTIFLIAARPCWCNVAVSLDN